MRNIFYILAIVLATTASVVGQQPAPKFIRIVDTLTLQEKNSRNPVILKTELDSLIKEYNVVQLQQQLIPESSKDENTISGNYIMGGLVAIIALLIFIVYIFYRHQRKLTKTISSINLKLKAQAIIPAPTSTSTTLKDKGNKLKSGSQSIEHKVNDLNAEVQKLKKENEGLNHVIKEYNGIQHEYASLKHRLLKVYKVKNYPGYDKTKDEALAMQGVLETEDIVANYAYEKFLKPVLAITDAHKNNPAKISETEREKLMELLLSLSLLYIEYLYLRVNDLSIGGKMVERIKGFSKGNGIDASLLKKLNTEFGSRALVIKMALNKAAIHQLSYPVFDETNLNNQ